ncbi:MAG: hypothetical protein WAL32_11295 [Terriglobales bacterium]
MLNISPALLKHTCLSITLTTALSMGTAFAQTTTPDPNYASPTTGETGSMDRYLNNHPGIANELHKDPSLINNPQWLAQHPKVQNFMTNHPAMKTDAANDPGKFVNHTERHDLANDHKALNGTNRFMKDHPEVAGELKKDPNLINDPNYLAKHPELNNYLAQHPGIRREAEAHPESFARAAEANNKYNHGDRVVPARVRK